MSWISVSFFIFIFVLAEITAGFIFCVPHSEKITDKAEPPAAFNGFLMAVVADLVGFLYKP